MVYSVMEVMPSQQGGHGGGKGEAAGHTESAVRAQSVVGAGTQLPMPYNSTQAPCHGILSFTVWVDLSTSIDSI